MGLGSFARTGMRFASFGIQQMHRGILTYLDIQILPQSLYLGCYIVRPYI